MTDFYERLTAIRHHLHAHPELSEQEVETTVFLREKLTELGIRILDLPLKTGLVAEIGQGEPIIALRADIDALPILEKTGLDYASTNGAMHACGNDLHMTSLLGAAEILKARESQLTGTLRLFFPTRRRSRHRCLRCHRGRWTGRGVGGSGLPQYAPAAGRGYRLPFQGYYGGGGEV